MPKSNDLKDAKDIDPLGMTRDLFGIAQAPPSAPPNDASENIAAEPAGSSAKPGAQQQAETPEAESQATGPKTKTNTKPTTEPVDADQIPVEGAAYEPDQRITDLKEKLTRELNTLLEELDAAATDSLADVPYP
tara:strand:- start:422 stop:823 length:402 start_codon:yes stop_codon:yes gene_type:complete